MSTASSPSGTGPGDLSLEQWLALNDEIAALVRAGLPLEKGLASAGRDLHGRTGGVALDMAARLESGASLDEAIAAEGARLPPVYGAVVRAGARSGRLGAALEGLADTAREQLELRRALSLALIYPLLVLSLAYLLFVGFVVWVLPRFEAIFVDFRIAPPPVMVLLGRSGDWVARFWLIGPVVLVAFLLLWAWSGRAGAFPGGGLRLLSWAPWTRSMARYSAAAGFADLTALLIEHDVPLAEAVELAGRSCGDRALERAALDLSGTLRAGGAIAAPAGFPPLLSWLIGHGNRQGRLAPALRHAAESYRRRGHHQATLVRTLLPIALTIVIGGTAVTIYVLTLFVPFLTLLSRLSVAA